jgi:heparan-alpha-glucosaminide N-acetyltransferase
MHGGDGTTAGTGVGEAPGARAAPRLLSLDLLRGLVVLLMLFVNQVDSVEGVSPLLRHGGEDADLLTLADLVLPAFLFMVGMSIPFALGTRLRRSGTAAAVWHVLTRALALLVIGVLMVNADVGLPGGVLPPEWWGVLAVVGSLLVWQTRPDGPALGAWKVARASGAALLVWLVLVYRGAEGGIVQIRPHWWGVLGTIGWAYLTAALVYLVVRDRPLALVGLVAALNGLYYLDVLVRPAWIVAVRPLVGIGGLIGSQGAVALAGTALGAMAARYQRENGAPWRLAAGGLTLALALVAAGTLLHAFGQGLHPSFVYNKESATPPWGLVSAGATALAWVAFFATADGAGWRRWPPLLRIAGQNALLTYLLEPIALTLLAASAVIFGRNPWAYLVERGAASALLAAVLFACLLGHLAGLLARAGVRPRL